MRNKVGRTEKGNRRTKIASAKAAEGNSTEAKKEGRCKRRQKVSRGDEDLDNPRRKTDATRSSNQQHETEDAAWRFDTTRKNPEANKER